MRVLVTGAYGFIGAHIVAALVRADHEVICAVREGRLDSRFHGIKAIACDMAKDITVDAWLPRLADIDAIVNCAGILRETPTQTFLAVHEQAPSALFNACRQLGVRKVIQISALGHPDDGEFVASKHRGDAILADMDLDWVIFRPSLVYSVHGSYGGSSLLRGLAALPWIMPVPGKGEQRVQPISAEDIGGAAVAALRSTQPVRSIIELVGPHVMDLRSYLLLWRHWLGFVDPMVVKTPHFLANIAASIGERLGNGPLGTTMLRMLARGNVGTAKAIERMRDVLGFTPKPLTQALHESPSHVQDRWHARLYFLLPTLRFTMALLWLLSGIVGWWMPADKILTSASGVAWPESQLLMLARGTATADLVLGALCLVRWRSRLVLWLMLAMLLGYTCGIGLLWPVHWLDPLGGLLKNLPLIVTLLVLLATDERR